MRTIDMPSNAFTVDKDGQQVRFADCAFSPANNTYQFPLEVGKKWNIDFTLTCPQLADNHTMGTGEVLDRETISTALGQMDTFHIVIKTGADQTEDSYWSTELGLPIKYHIQGSALVADGEVVSYTPAK
jgi:hypothetical protein